LNRKDQKLSRNTNVAFACSASDVVLASALWGSLQWFELTIYYIMEGENMSGLIAC